MKICVLGLDCAAPDIIFQDERLVNIRRLMDLGVYGRLQSVVPPITVPAWMCMATSQDPGSLGLYGFRNRADHSYENLRFANSTSIKALAIWDYLARQGKKSIIVGVPPNFPPRRVNGISIGCFLTPDPARDEFVYPPAFKAKITELVGEYPVDVKNFRTERKDWLRDQIFAMSRKQWKVVHWLLQEQEWDYFHFVDIGLDRVHHGFWDCFDKQHINYQAGNPYENVIPDYYLWLDEQIGRVMESLDDDTALLVFSDHGAQKLDGGFAVNQWLIEQGMLVLNRQPEAITPFNQLDVNWAKTLAWSEGGYYARIFLNVQGREPQGVIPAGEYESFRNQLKMKLEAIKDDGGRPLNSPVFKPDEIYQRVRNVAPDLIVYFGGLCWRSIGTVGHDGNYLRENDSGPDACNHSQFGMFTLASPNWPVQGECEGVGLLDLAPTLMDLAGFAIPESMQGKSLLARMQKLGPGLRVESGEAEKAIHDRLAGLGYI
jgi:predicted AlkP superfamily phosphohydrolase/phosphomutase